MKNWVSKILPFTARALLAVVVLVIGFVVFGVLKASRPQVPRIDVEDAIRRVETWDLRRLSVQRTWQGFGTASAMNTAEVTAEISAIVLDIPDGLRVGDPADAGRILVQLDDTDVRQRERLTLEMIKSLNAQLDSLVISEVRTTEQLALATEEIELAQSDYERALESQRRGGASETELDRLRRTVKAAKRIESELRRQVELIEPRRVELNASIAAEEARLVMVRRDLARCTIRSPISGVIQTLHVEEGEQVMVGMPIARIVDIEHIEVELTLPISARQSIRMGDEVKLTAEGARSDCWTGEVSRMSPEGDRNLRTFMAYVEIEQSQDANPLLVPGQFVSAEVVTALNEEYLTLPRRAVLEDGVWVIAEDSTAEPRRVDVLFHVPQSAIAGTSDGYDNEWAAVSDDSDLAVGDRIILSHTDEMKPGLPVKPRDRTAERSNSDADAFGG